jgi:hypothetical protein
MYNQRLAAEAAQNEIAISAEVCSALYFLD